MNERLCIATWVYGRKYQGWIPVYVYSIKKNYPEYDIKIFVDGMLSLGIKRLLEKYKLTDSVQIIENILKKDNFPSKSDMEKRCIRWLIGGDRFKEYDYVYMGDIDIYIVKEEEDLLQQHIKMIQKTRWNYSNAIRLTLADYYKYRKKMDSRHLMRLTGLHFIKVNEYYKQIKKAQQFVLKYLLSKKRIRFIDDLFFKDDERCLWLIIFLSHLGFPKESYELSSDNIRPLHGVHFAQGREYIIYKDLFRKNETRNKEHKVYFDKFRQEYNSDFELRKLVFDSPFYILEIIKNTCGVWGATLSRNEINTI